jgi:hypothetical protein
MSSHETPELGPQQIPELALASQLVHACPSVWLSIRVFNRFPNWSLSKVRAIDSWDSGLPHVRDSSSSPNQDSRTLHIREFETSQVPGFRESRIPCSWKTCFENFVKLNVSRVTGFPEFPNNAIGHFGARRGRVCVRVFIGWVCVCVVSVCVVCNLKKIWHDIHTCFYPLKKRPQFLHNHFLYLILKK